MVFKNKTNIKHLHSIVFSLIFLLLVSFLFFVVESLQIASETNENTFSYTVKIRRSIEEIDKVFERAEVNVNILADTIANTYDINKQNDKAYNFKYIKETDGLVKSVLGNSPGVYGTWFQLNADLPFSASAYNWYGFRNEQFIDLKSQFEGDASIARKITPEDDPYYFGAINDQKATWSDIYKDADSNIDMMTISQPVYKNGTLVGVVGIDISVDNLKQALRNMQSVFSSSEIFLTDKKNNIILSQLLYDSRVAGKKYPFLALFKEDRNEEGMVQYYENGIKKTAILLALSNKDNLIITFEDRAIFVGFSHLFNTIYFIFTIMLALVVMAFFVDFNITSRKKIKEAPPQIVSEESDSNQF